jgi:hypothetical protein
VERQQAAAEMEADRSLGTEVMVGLELILVADKWIQMAAARLRREAEEMAVVRSLGTAGTAELD